MRNQISKYSDNIREAESHFLPSNYLNGKYNMSRTGTKTLSLMGRTFTNTPGNEARIRGYQISEDTEVFS